MTNVMNELVPLDKIFMNTSSPVVLSKTETFKHTSINNDPTILVNKKPFITQKYYAGDLSIPEDERMNILHPVSNYNLNVAGTFNPHAGMHVFVTQHPALNSFFGKNIPFIIFPMYVQNELSGRVKLNIDEKFIHKISHNTGLTFITESVPTGNVCMAGNSEFRPDFRITFSPTHLLNYIYAAAQSTVPPEMIMTDAFSPHIPVPVDSDMFWQLVEAGTILRELHLLQSPHVKSTINNLATPLIHPTEFPLKVEQLKWEANSDGKSGRIWLNDKHHIPDILLSSWNFSIGDYYPLRQWNEYRQVTFFDEKALHHFVSIINVVSKTTRMIAKIDKILNRSFT